MAQQAVPITDLPSDWQNALSRFKEITNDSLTASNIKDIETLVEAIEKQHVCFESYRQRGEKLRHYLRIAMALVGELGTVAAAGASLAFPPAQAIYQGVQLLFGAGKNVGAVYDAILEVLGKIYDFNTRLKIYVTHQDTRLAMQPIVVETLKIYLDVFALSIKRIRHHRWEKLGLFVKFTLLGNDDEINNAIRKLENNTQKEQLQLAAHTSAAVEDLAKEICPIIKETKRLVESLAAALLQKTTEELVGRHGPEFESVNTYQGRHLGAVPRTGVWIQGEKYFRDWVDRKNPILWICGAEGDGKSYLAAKIVDYLQDLYPPGESREASVSTAFFFCEHDPGEQRLDSLATALRSIAYQISKYDPKYVEYLEQNEKQLNGFVKFWQPVESLWKVLFLDYFSKPGCHSSVYIVIYGLDKIVRAVKGHHDLDIPKREKKAFLKLLNELQQNSNNPNEQRISVVLMASPKLGPDLAMFQIPRIDITPAKTISDMKLYVEYTVDQISFLDPGDKFRERIVEEVAAKANGFFQWASSILGEFSGTHGDEEAIEEILSEISTGMSRDSQIQEIIERSTGGRRPRVKSEQVRLENLKYILRWVLVAYRNLSIASINQALLIRSEKRLGIRHLGELLRNDYGDIFTFTTRKGAVPFLDSGPSIVDDDSEWFAETDQHEIEPRQTRWPLAQEDERLRREMVRKITDDDDTLFVAVRHSSIRAFLLDPIQAQPLGVFVDEHSTKILILQTCLQIFCEAPKFQYCKTGLARHAAHFDEYLLKISISDIDIHQKCEIAKLLVQVIREEEPANRWVQYSRAFLTQLLLVTPNFLRTFQTWLNDGEVKDYFSHELSMCSWTKKASSSPIPYDTILKNVALQCGRQWLNGKAANLEYEVLFIHHYLEKVQRPIVDIVAEVDFQRITGERILDLARYVGMDPDTSTDGYQLYRLAMTLLRAGAAQLAVDYGVKSADIDSNKWQTHSILANAYFELGDLTSSSRRFDLCQKAMEREKFEATRQELEKIYGSESNLASQGHLLKQLDPMNWTDEQDQDDMLKMGEYEQATKSMSLLLESSPTANDLQKWTEFFFELSRHIPHNGRLLIYALKTQQLELVDKLYKLGLKILSSKHVDGVLPVFRYHYAMLYLKQGFQRDRALDLMKDAVTQLRSSPIDKAYSKLKYLAPIELETFYLISGLVSMSDPNSTDNDSYEKHFGELRMTVDASETIYTAILVLVVWYRRTGQAVDCRTYARKAIQQALDDLSRSEDESSTMIQDAWYLLADSLTAAGEHTDAVAALSYIKQGRWHKGWAQASILASDTPKKQNSKTQDANDGRRTFRETRYSPEIAIVNGRYSGFSCDACGRFILSSEQHRHCSVCITVDFCNYCYTALSVGEMRLNICSKDHELVVIPAVPKSYEWRTLKVGEGEGKMMSVDNWLKELRAKWCN